MPATTGLSDDDLDRYHRDGFVFPLTVLSADEASAVTDRVDEHLRASAQGVDLLELTRITESVAAP